MLEFLPQTIKDALSHVNLHDIYEIRLRATKPTRINFCGKYVYLGYYGITELREKAVICDMEEIADCIFRAGKYSVYSVEEQIKKGFLTAENGERIGIAGEYVFDKGQPLALKNITSLCVRVPHEVVGCGQEIYERCMSDRIQNLLICSPPGIGKTTILRDLARIIGEKTQKNILICDERGEISAGNVGESADILKYSDKGTAFEAGIRAMRPDIILTDELSLSDCVFVEKAITAGVNVLASAHFSDINVLKKPFLGLFDRYVFLEENQIGRIQGIYDQAGREI